MALFTKVDLYISRHFHLHAVLVLKEPESRGQCTPLPRTSGFGSNAEHGMLFRSPISVWGLVSISKKRRGESAL